MIDALQAAADLARLLRAARAAGPEALARPALSFYREGRLVERASWAALLADVERASHALASRHGVRRGDRVALLMPNGEHTVAVMLAVLSLGAVAVPLNPTLEPHDWRHAAEDCGACGVVVASPLTARSGELSSTLGFCCSDGSLLRGPLPPADPSCQEALADAPAVILYTSGTTGAPKGVVLSHANLLANGRAMAAHFGLRGEPQLAVMPLYHAHALGFGLMTMLVSGGHLVLADRFNAFHWTSIIQAEQVRVTSLVPPLLPFLLKLRARAAAVPTLRALLVSSAPLAADLARELIAQTGLPLVQGWGLSEFTNFATCTDLSPLPEPAHHPLLGHAWPSIGRPLPGFEVQVRGPRGDVQAPGLPGELVVRGASRMLGYFGHPPAEDEWLATGDEGYFGEDERGPFFFITGRLKDLIIRDAEKLSPLAIERRLLAACPALEGRLAVVGFTHALHGEEIGAYIESQAEGGDAVDGEAVQRLLSCADALPDSLRPKVVLCGARPIPRTHTGKVQRRRLRPLFAGHDRCSGPTRLECTA